MEEDSRYSSFADLKAAAIRRLEYDLRDIEETEERLARRRHDNHRQRQVLEEAEQILVGPIVLAAPAEAATKDAAPRQLRARMGAQRYAMFHHLYLDNLIESKGHTYVGLAECTRLEIRRIREQMNSDIAAGLVEESDGFLRITPAGVDLFDRVVAYRQSRGLPLPAPNDPVTEDDSDEGSDGEENSDDERSMAA